MDRRGFIGGVLAAPLLAAVGRAPLPQWTMSPYRAMLRLSHLGKDYDIPWYWFRFVQKQTNLPIPRILHITREALMDPNPKAFSSITFPVVKVSH